MMPDSSPFDAPRYIRASEIHARIGNGWPALLAQLGVTERLLSKKHGPCPGCGGNDRYFFDNKYGRGDFYCRKCGNGDGFKLLSHVFGWTFSEARRRVMEQMGLVGGQTARAAPEISWPAADTTPSRPTQRVLRLQGGRCAVEDCADAVDYLASRGLWPLPAGCTLKAHASVEYWNDGQRLGRFPALVADVVDVADELVTCHVTYLRDGRKLADHEPRKIFSAMTNRNGCAVRLMQASDVLGVAEGIETALSAALIHNVSVWAAINTTLLAKFQPPASIQRLLIFADRDEPGLLAAAQLMERLQSVVRVELKPPAAQFKDWNDQLKNQLPAQGQK